MEKPVTEAWQFALFSITCACARGFPQRARLPARVEINPCPSGLRAENPAEFSANRVSPCFRSKSADFDRKVSPFTREPWEETPQRLTSCAGGGKMKCTARFRRNLPNKHRGVLDEQGLL
jgi:hypothetical protein